MKKASKKTGLRINQISPGANVVLSTFMILLAAVFVIPVLLYAMMLIYNFINKKK